MKKPVIKIQTLSVYISTTLVLLLLGIMGMLLTGGQSASDRIKESFRMTATIDSNVSEERILKLQQDIDSKEYTLDSRYISKEMALQEMNASLGADHTELLGENPYLAEIEINLKKEFANVGEMARIEKELRKNSIITDVDYPKGHIDTVNKNINKAAMVLLVLFTLLTIISWALISNLVRLSIYSKRFLLHTMKLVGASWEFIRRPFLLKNLCIGLVSGIIANLILGTGIYLLGEQSPDIASLFPASRLAIVGIGVIAFGIIICTLCAFLSVNRFLRMRNNDLYFI